MTQNILFATQRILPMLQAAAVGLGLILATGCESSGGGGGGGHDFGDRDPSACAVIGDSISVGYGAEGAPWPARLAGLLDRSVANHGVGGITTSQGLSILDGVLARDAGIIIISLGANDAINGISADAVRNNLGTMIQRIRDANGLPVVGNITPMTAGHSIFYPQAERINEAIRDLCSSEGVLLVNLNKVVTFDMLQPDGLHPNSDGQEAIANAFYNRVRSRVE